jgi:LacI family transcriptional regulator, repressor for deo operon, udp, cdd, tsx, nupC, and nupG
LLGNAVGTAWFYDISVLSLSGFKPPKAESKKKKSANDLSAIGVIQAARKLGLKVPEQLSVTGADGLDLNGLLDLTTYISPSYEVGQQSVELLLKIISKQEHGTPQIRIPVEFVQGSTVSRIA